MGGARSRSLKNEPTGAMINLKTSKQIGVINPRRVLARADRVIK